MTIGESDNYFKVEEVQILRHYATKELTSKLSLQCSLWFLILMAFIESVPNLGRENDRLCVPQFKVFHRQKTTFRDITKRNLLSTINHCYDPFRDTLNALNDFFNPKCNKEQDDDKIHICKEILWVIVSYLDYIESTNHIKTSKLFAVAWNPTIDYGTRIMVVLTIPKKYSMQNYNYNYNYCLDSFTFHQIQPHKNKSQIFIGIQTFKHEKRVNYNGKQYKSIDFYEPGRGDILFKQIYNVIPNGIQSKLSVKKQHKTREYWLRDMDIIEEKIKKLKQEIKQLQLQLKVLNCNLDCDNNNNDNNNNNSINLQKEIEIKKKKFGENIVLLSQIRKKFYNYDVCDIEIKPNLKLEYGMSYLIWMICLNGEISQKLISSWDFPNQCKPYMTGNDNLNKIKKHFIFSRLEYRCDNENGNGYYSQTKCQTLTSYTAVFCPKKE